MIEIRELIIRAVVTKNATSGGDKPTGGAKGQAGNTDLNQLMEVLHDKNER